MEKFIYHDKILRCRLKATGYKNQIELQIQKRYFIIWINVYKWMHVQDGFWGECERFPVIKLDSSYGHNSEAYMSGTLDLEKRTKEFFKEYLGSQEMKFNRLLNKI
jgi:hypothetical protein